MFDRKKDRKRGAPQVHQYIDDGRNKNVIPLV